MKLFLLHRKTRLGDVGLDAGDYVAHHGILAALEDQNLLVSLAGRSADVVRPRDSLLVSERVASLLSKMPNIRFGQPVQEYVVKAPKFHGRIVRIEQTHGAEEAARQVRDTLVNNCETTCRVSIAAPCFDYDRSDGYDDWITGEYDDMWPFGYSRKAALKNPIVTTGAGHVVVEAFLDVILPNMDMRFWQIVRLA